MQHFIGYPTNSSYLCGKDAIGRRNTRTDTNPALTTCRACKTSPISSPKQQPSTTNPHEGPASLASTPRTRSPQRRRLQTTH